MSNQTDNAVLEPHLTDHVRSGARYPNPFFDLSQQYAPRTIKELFEWCTFFFYTNPLIGSTISKISRYPITDLVIDEDDAKVKDLWNDFYYEHLKVKDRMMEVNLDLNVYGNAFVSLHLPFTRMLVCGNCGTKTDIKETNWKWQNFKFCYICPNCKKPAEGDPAKPESITDIPYRSVEDIKVIRWNPENITIKYNEATGRSVYYYSPSSMLRQQVNQGDEDILEDIPLLFIRAIKESRVIKLSTPNIFHLKRPTLAEKDMGWGKPLIYQVLKDIYYLYTLRRAQEAIANEHIVPFDILYPQPNAQMDPFVHTDLGNWRSQVEDQIKKHRWDPNYKAIIPVPIGFGRLGGNGKNLMLTPELNYLNQIIVGGMGIPSEFLFGGLNWTGSSVTLRSLQNDFLHNQTQLLDLVNWVTRKVSLFLKRNKPKKVRFLDFKMADDVQKIQQMIGLNAARKVSDDTLLTELGLDYEKEKKKIVEEIQDQNEIQDIIARAQAKTSGESQIIQYNYQEKLEELKRKSMKKLEAKGEAIPGQGFFAGEQSLTPEAEEIHRGQMTPDEAVAQPGYQDQQSQEIPGAAPAVSSGGQNTYLDVHKMVKSWATKLSKMEPTEQAKMLMQIKQQMPSFGDLVEKTLNEMLAKGEVGPAAAAMQGAAPIGGEAGGVNMKALPEQRAPRRKGEV